MDFLNKKNTTTDPYDTDKMANEFLQQYIDHAFATGQCVCHLKLHSFENCFLFNIVIVTISIYG